MPESDGSFLSTMARLSGDSSRQAVEPELDSEALERDVGVTWPDFGGASSWGADASSGSG
jgi:hypothetical protein